MTQIAEKPNRVQGMARSFDQWLNMVPHAVADGSKAQVECAPADASHGIEVLWRDATSTISPAYSVIFCSTPHIVSDTRQMSPKEPPMNKIEALKPCPFCGRDLEFSELSSRRTPLFVHPADEGRSCPGASTNVDASDPESVARWNTRAALTASEAKQ